MFFYQVDEIIKKVTAVMRAGCAFGVILYRESRLIFQADAFDAVIIQVPVRYFHMTCFLYGFRVYAKAMVLRGHFAFAGKQVHYRVVEPAMTVMQFERIDAIGKRQQLVAEANAEGWFFFFQNVFYGIDRIVHY